MMAVEATMSSSSTYNHHLVESRYGRTPESDEHARNYLTMLKIVMSEDGELTEAAAFEQFLHGLEISGELIAEVDAFETRGASVKDVVPALRPDGQLARLLIRDMVELMSADGVYRMEERASVAKLAHELGVRRATVNAIETLVNLERSAARLHEALFRDQ